MSIIYQSVSKPLQQTQMASIVYVQNAQPNSMAYYATEPAINQQPMQQIQQQHSPFMYPVTASPQCMQGTPQQAIVPESYVAERTPFYAYQPALHETGSNFVCLVPTVALNNSAQLSMLFHSLGSNSPSLHASPALLAQETHPTPQVMQQMLAVDSMQIMMESHAPQPQLTIEGSVKPSFPESSEVCRHYISGRCNRRKCRFLHPDLRNVNLPSAAAFVPADTGSLINKPSVTQVSPLTPYSSLSTASLNSLHAPTPTSWETHPR
ncbi:hypothetical protein LSCM1_01209 [Leishmania martiniquensis]|uniref:C3H1-type domain-containing protein n=1 Tax=Leishmania martiniquensis TaxID=1580590 RepID=A0A836K8D2_9TRYP|nr:hypothetical protein LSCM1_01209 [Leishmania martiniquensis]